MKLHEWEHIAAEDNEITSRMRVPGGWLYREAHRAAGETARNERRLSVSVSLVFVPCGDPEIVLGGDTT